MIICYLALGSNICHPRRQLARGVKHLQSLPQSIILQASSIYRSVPMQASPLYEYHNMVVKLATRLSPAAMLRSCQEIEIACQRFHKYHNQPRTLDIDIILYGQQTIITPDLVIPHPRMLIRRFVLVPLLELDPLLTMPDATPIATYNAKLVLTQDVAGAIHESSIPERFASNGFKGKSF